MKKNIFKISTPLSQIILIVITFIIISFITHKFMSSSRIKDPEPHLSEFNSESKKLLINSSPIDVGFYIQGFNKFDLLNDEFFLRGIVWFVFDSKKISADDLKQFSFFRSEQMDVEVYDKEEIKLSESKNLIRYMIKLKFASNLDFSLYPFDDHRIYFILNNKFIPIQKGYFRANLANFKFENDVQTPGWELIGKGVKVGYSEFLLDNKDPKKTIDFPRIIFYMDFKNDNLKNIIIIFLPLFITFFIFTFFISTEYAKHQDLITGIAAGAIPSILGYRFVIEAISPKISYFTFSDYIFALIIVFSFVIFLINFYLEKIKHCKGYIIVGIYLFLIIAWQYLLYSIGAIE